MKLYYSPGACSLTTHILLNELGLTYKLEKVSIADQKTASGADFSQINPKGYVPVLEMPNGELLTENAAIAQYLADLKPQLNLLPPFGKTERYHVLAWLNYVATELHKNFSPLFNKNTTAEHKQFSRDLLIKRLSFVSQSLGSKECLFGVKHTVADFYLFNVLLWTKYVEINLADWPNLLNFVETLKKRPSVQKAFEEEGMKG